MHLLAHFALDAHCAIRDAYDITTDMTRFGEWFPQVLDIRSIDDLPPGTTGKAYLETVRMPLGKPQQIRLQVTDAIPGRFFATEGAFAPLMPRMEIRYAPGAAGHCRISWAMYSRNPHRALRFTLLPLIGLTLRGRATSARTNLGKLLAR